ncbi:MAG: conjugal transfer mating pair stabilization protein TraN [Actinomycetota bacterium]
MLRALRQPKASAPIAWLVATALILVQTLPLHADELDDAGATGQAFGQDILPTDPDDLSVTDPVTGRLTLVPGTGDELEIGLDELFPGADIGTIDELRSLQGDLAATAERGRLQQEAPHTGAGSDEAVEAYGVFLDSGERGQPDLTDDPVWDLTGEVLAGIPGLTDSFGDCATTTSILPTSTTAHVPDLRTCERILTPPALCTLTHDYGFELVAVTGGTYSAESCGPGCLDLWVGTVGNDYWSGACTVHEAAITLDVLNPDAVISATLDRVVYDDHHQVWLDDSLVWQSRWGFPPETTGLCERGASNDTGPAVDVTARFREQGRLSFRNRTSVAGLGEGYSRIRLIYDPAKALVRNDWGPADCLETARLVANGACTGSATTLAGPSGESCIRVGGVPLCPEQLPLPDPSLRSLLPPLATSVRITSDCALRGGSMGCWLDPSGALQCPTTTPTVRDSCGPLANDPSCAFVSASCIDGARLPDGRCLVAEDRYDCGYDVTIPSAETVTELSCVGDVRCMGDDCFEPPTESSTGFAEAVAKLKAAQLVAMDADCSTGVCEVFAGRAMTCKKAVGGIVDCCDTPAGISLSQYLSLLFAVQELDGAIRALDTAPLLRGAWETLADPFIMTWDAVTMPFTTVLETVSGATGAVSQAASQGLFTFVRQALYHQTAEWTLAAFGEGAVTALFQSVSAGEPLLVGGAINGSAEIALGGIVGSAVSVVLVAYTIYALTSLLIQLIWRCEEAEFELGVNRELKQCRYNGAYCNTELFGCFDKRESYCCFGSPLSRILQEQARPQLGLDWGTAKDPECRALSMTELGAIDWDRVDLDEWLGILASSGQIPDVTRLDLTTLTGEARSIGQAIPGMRPDALTRTEDRLEGLPGDTLDVRNDAAAELGTDTGAAGAGGTAPCRFEPRTGAPVDAGELAFAECRAFCGTSAVNHPRGAQCRFGAAIIDVVE